MWLHKEHSALLSKDSQPTPKPSPSLTDQTLGRAPRGPSRFTLLGGLAVILVLCAVLTMLTQSTGQLASSPEDRLVAGTPPVSLLASDSASKTGMLFMILPGAGNEPDIFYLAPTPNVTPANLTDSAGMAELNPSVSPDGKTIAFFARDEDSRTDLYVRPVPNGQARPITVQTGNTQLHNGFDIGLEQSPEWSLDGTWLAFLTRQSDGKGGAVELYIVRGQGGDLRAVTDGNQVIDFTWLSDNEISYIQVRGNNKGTVYRQVVDNPAAPPIPVATLQVQR